MRYFLAVFCLLLSSCGFHPIYKQSGVPTELDQRLKSVDVVLLRGTRAEQIFSTELADLLDPQSKATAKPYLLELQYKRDEQPAIVQQDRTITRFRIMLTGSYVLKDKASGKVLDKGKATQRVTYDDLTNEFANYSAQTDSEERAARELAEQIRQRLLGYFNKADK